VGTLLAVTGCSSADDLAAPGTITAGTTAAPASTLAPPTTASPTTLAAPTSASSPPTSAIGPARQAALSAILEAHRAAGEFVGGYIAVRDSDATISEATSGTRTLDPASGPVDTDMPWNIGSVTKIFVAVVVLQLAEEGLIDLDAGIERFFPDLADAERITPRQLLQHTSGLGEYHDQPSVLNDSQREWTPTELIAVAEAAGRVGEPGGPYHYSNTNYIMLGQIIEQVTGHAWADEVRTRIIEPLGLTHTGAIGAEQAPGYTLVDGSFVEATTSEHPSLGGAAGGMQSTDHACSCSPPR
jgi:D-alanyl-D-alanine carboxypeptidase